MNFLSVCSGIDAASVAWKPLGWNPIAFSEIEPFPCSVLAYHYPSVPNLGDMTKYKEWNLETTPDVLISGTPCQSFSVAGLRAGLDDPRGGLTLVLLRIVDRTRPRYLVWENVPGVLSSNGGRDFGSLLGGLALLGYGFAYRVLDAQYWGLAQRRKRVFLVASPRGWRRCAEVLFQTENFSRHLEESAGEREDPSPDPQGGARGDYLYSQEIANPLTARMHKGINTTMDEGQTMVVFRKSRRAQNTDDAETWVNDGIANTLNNFDVGDRDTHAVVNFTNADNGVADPITASEGKTYTHEGSRNFRLHNVVGPKTVRRLTPRECERLQGFPDDYTLVPHRGKPAADGPRYKALGNSMAVNVMRWIGRRIQMVEDTSDAQRNKS